jgi:hypothetical protein
MLDEDRYWLPARTIKDKELDIIKDVSGGALFPEGILVRQFDVDHSHTIRKCGLTTGLRLLSEGEMEDSDGSKLLVLVFVDEQGSFGELEVSRMDLEPIIKFRPN